MFQNLLRTEQLHCRYSILVPDLLGEGNSRLDNEQAWEEEGTDEEDDDKDDVLTHFAEAMDMFKAKIVSAYEGKLKKGIKFFTNKLRKFANQNNTTLEKSLFNIGKEANAAKTSGKKRKNGKRIPVQVTAKSRRQYKHRGRAVGTLGRRNKDQEQRNQMVIGENSENVYHTLPKQKVLKNKQAHSLKEAVDSNRPGAKKH